MRVTRRVLTVLALASLLTACVAPRTPIPAPLGYPETVRVRSSGRVVTVPIEDYVLGSALSEVSPVGAAPGAVARIFDVQAILARTYALAHLGRHREEGFDLCDTTHCQLYEPSRIGASRFTAPARDAVSRTRGVVLLFGRHPLEALYHSDCGGHTASATDVWGGADVPYLVGRPDDPPAVAHRTWQIDVPADKLRAALNEDGRTAVGRRLASVAVAARDTSGRVASIRLIGERTCLVRGEDLRSIVNRSLGDRAIMSTRFSVTQRGSTFRFAGTGFGHGVGLCQTGAAARAAAGRSAVEILAAYFPGSTLSWPMASAKSLGGRPPSLLHFSSTPP